MSLGITELNGVKIYNLSAGKTLPQFLEEAYKKSRSLRYNEEYRKRVELIQDFDFPAACTQVEVSPDEQYIVATGVYAPRIRIYETSQLTMKCERGLDSEVVKFCILDQDYSKLAFACIDRGIEFHAAYGRHYRLRVPKQPRNMIYNPFTCDLLVSASSNEIYRLSLDEGVFLSSFSSLCTGISALAFNKHLNLLITGGNNGIVEYWDYRMRERIRHHILNQGEEITEIACDEAMTYAVGSEKGLTRIYDVRADEKTSQTPYLLEIRSRYKQPINTIRFHEKSRTIITASRRILRLNNRDTGAIFTSIEPKSEINRFELCPNSGLIFVASEEPRIGCYFIPQLDTAPRWCPFIENLTEELEEEQAATVYDEFKFCSREDLEALDCTNLIGSRLLKPHLHGFLMHMKLYQKLKAKSELFQYQEYKRNLMAQRFESLRESRVAASSKENVEDKEQNFQAKVNADYAEQLMKKDKGKRFDPKQILQDERFRLMFEKDEFKLNKDSQEWLLTHPSDRNREQEPHQEDEDEDATELNLRSKELRRLAIQKKSMKIRKDIARKKKDKMVPFEKKVGGRKH